jgi:hypothetical protein
MDHRVDSARVVGVSVDTRNADVIAFNERLPKSARSLLVNLISIAGTSSLLGRRRGVSVEDVDSGWLATLEG